MHRCLNYLIASMLCACLASNALAAWPEGQRTEFKTEDDVIIAGDFYPADGEDKAPLAIMLHMYRHERSTWKPLIKPLHDAGFAILAIDLRGHGESLQPDSMRLNQRAIQRDPGLFNAMHLDVEAAMGWAKAQSRVDMEHVVLVGASVGCSVALDVCARDERIDAVVCMTPGTKYLGVDSTAHIKKTRNVPILLLATEDEREATDELSEMAENAKGEIVGEGKVHGTNMFGKIDGIEQKIVDFFKKAIK